MKESLLVQRPCQEMEMVLSLVYEIKVKFLGPSDLGQRGGHFLALRALATWHPVCSQSPARSDPEQRAKKTPWAKAARWDPYPTPPKVEFLETDLSCQLHRPGWSLAARSWVLRRMPDPRSRES